MKSYFYVVLMSIMMAQFFACTSVEDVTSVTSTLLGKWHGDTGIKFLNDDGSVDTVITEIVFKDDQTYKITTLNTPDNFPLFSEPYTSGNWEMVENESKIRLFQGPTEILNVEGFVYFWKINSLDENLLDVSVYDKDGVLIRNRKFTKVE